MRKVRHKCSRVGGCVYGKRQELVAVGFGWDAACSVSRCISSRSSRASSSVIEWLAFSSQGSGR